MLRRSTPSSAQLTGGDLSVDILHTEDSVRLGDGTDLLSFTTQAATKCIPVDVKATVGATDATLTGGSQKTKISDGVDPGVVEIDDVGGEKALKVSVIASVGGGGGGTAATDSAAYTATSSQFTPVGGAYDDTASDALAEGEMGMVRLTSARAMHVAVQNTVPVTGTFWQATQPVSIASMPATPVTDNGGSLTVDGSVGITGSVAVTGTFWQATQPVSIAAAVAVTDNNSTLSIDDGAGSITVDGTVAATQSGAWNIGTVTTLTSITNAVAVTDNGGSLTVDGTVGISGSVAVTGTFWQATQPVSGTVTASNTAGDVAHDGADSGNPVKVGGVARNANPTAVANGDRVNATFDLLGKQVITPHVPRDLVVQANGSQSTTTEASMIAAGGAGVFHDITKMVFTNTNTTTDALVQIRDATAGTIRFEHVVPKGGGMVVDFGMVPMCQTTANSAWTIDLNAAVSSVYYYVQAIKRTA